MSSITRADAVSCASCGAVIARKAIVCYRCGTPTAVPAAPPRPAAPEPSPAAWVAPIAWLVAAGVVVWLALSAAPDSWLRAGGYGLAALSGFAGVVAVVRRGRLRGGRRAGP